MENIKNVKEVGKDNRVRSFVLPTKVVLTKGKVRNANTLLKKHSLQIHLRENQTAFFDNRNSDQNAAVLLDFAQELHGGVRILCAATQNIAYPKIRIRFGESVSEALSVIGTKNAVNDHSICDMVVTTTMMSDQEWGQTGFRFIYIELLEPDAAIDLKSILAVFVYQDLPYRGSFSCNDQLINKIFDTSAYTCHLCMQNLLWDGIKRDRLVWIGDSHPEMLTIRSVFGPQLLMEQSLTDICKMTPLPGWMNGMPTYSMWWLCIIWDWYQYTGKRSYPKKHLIYITSLTKQILNCINDDGKIILDQYFLDWPSYQTPDAEDGVQALAILAMQAALGLLCLFDDYKELIQNVKTATEKLKQYNADRTNSKPAAALLYLSGILSKDKTAEKLCDGGAKGISTFMSYYILKAVSKTSDTGTALNMLRKYYGGMLNMGATTFWEDFSIDWLNNSSPIDRLPKEGEHDIHGDFGAYCYKGFRQSLCHGWASGPVPFLMECVLGIKFIIPGGKQIEICPSLGNLLWTEGTYPLPDGGDLWVRCEKDDNDKVNIKFKAPIGITVKTIE